MRCLTTVERRPRCRASGLSACGHPEGPVFQSRHGGRGEQPHSCFLRSLRCLGFERVLPLQLRAQLVARSTCPTTGGWRDCSASKSTGWFRGPEFNSQHAQDGSEPSVTPVSEDPVPSSDFQGHQACTWLQTKCRPDTHKIK